MSNVDESGRSGLACNILSLASVSAAGSTRLGSISSSGVGCRFAECCFNSNDFGSVNAGVKCFRISWKCNKSTMFQV